MGAVRACQDRCSRAGYVGDGGIEHRRADVPRRRLVDARGEPIGFFFVSCLFFFFGCAEVLRGLHVCSGWSFPFLASSGCRRVSVSG